MDVSSNMHHHSVSANKVQMNNCTCSHSGYVAGELHLQEVDALLADMACFLEPSAPFQCLP